MIHDVRLLGRTFTVKLVDTSNRLEGTIGQLKYFTKGKRYEDLSFICNTPKGMYSVRNDNKAIVRVNADRFTERALSTKYSKDISPPVSDTDKYANLIKTYEGAE